MQQGFVNEILVNLKCRTFVASQDRVLSEGDQVDEIFFIQQGQLQLCETRVTEEPFCILPTFSIYGEYHVLNKVPIYFNVRTVKLD
jgi:hypothetical protein